MEHLSLHGPAVYNPGLWSPEELKNHFVARLDTLERILDDLRRERKGSPAQHRLILGLRGMGKSTLLRRVALAVDEDENFHNQWLPLTFPEEQYNVAGPADLWINCLDALGDYLEEHGDQQAAADLDRAIENMPANAEAALHLLLAEADKRQRRLLLLIDNIDLVLDRLKKHHWGLREIFQSETRFKLIGASANAIEATYRYESAFYDFFVIDELKGLTIEEMRATLTRLSELGKTPQVVELLDRDPARIKTLHTLTGGNPRTVVLLHTILGRGLDGDVRSDLEGLLDLVTPLYKARFEELPAQGQQVVDALAVHWDPMTAKQLADSLGWEVNTVSSQLNRLQQQAVVEKVAPGRGKRAAFQIGERFFNIWYLMRASRRVRRKLIWLVHFLRMFFNAQELCDHAHKQLKSGCNLARDAEYHLALAQALHDRPLRTVLEHQALSTLLKSKKNRESIASILDLRGEDAVLRPQVECIKQRIKARQRIDEVFASLDFDIDRETLRLRMLGSPTLSPLSIKFITAMAGCNKEQWEEVAQILNDEWNELIQEVPTAVEAIYKSIAEGIMETAEDIEGAEASAIKQNNLGIAAFAWTRWLKRNKPNKEQAERAEKVFASFLQNEPANVLIWRSLGELFFKNQRYSDSEEAFRNILTHNNNDDRTWYKLSSVMLEQKKNVEAEEACRKALEINPRNTPAWYRFAAMLLESERCSELEEACRKALAITPNNSVLWVIVGLLLSTEGEKFDEVEKAFQKALENNPEEPTFYELIAKTYHSLSKKLPKALELAKRAAAWKEARGMPKSPILCTLLVANGFWQEAERCILHLIKESDEEIIGSNWSGILTLFSEVIKANKATEALKLLDQTSAGERWRPLREALASAAAKDIRLLNGIAPEVRVPALEILKIIAPDLVEP